jgi:hypothetical protein
MKHERPKNYPHYRRNKYHITDEALELAMHFGASPREIQKALDNKKQAELPQARK